MKRIEKHILTGTNNGNPIDFEFNGSLYRIEAIEERWVLQGNWWVREEERTYFRVRTQKGIAVIYHRLREGDPPCWMLAELFD